MAAFLECKCVRGCARECSVSERCRYAGDSLKNWFSLSVLVERVKHEDISFQDSGSSVNVVSSLGNGRFSLTSQSNFLMNECLLKDFLWHPEANNSMKERLMSWTQVSRGLVSSEGLERRVKRS